MANPDLHRLNLAPLWLERLQQRSMVAARDVILSMPLDLMETLDLNGDEVEQLQARVSHAVLPCCITLKALHSMQVQQQNFLPTHLQTLDDALKGGIYNGGITEVVGPAGAGKSQLCHMLSMLSLLHSSQHGQQGGVVYIDTEKKFSATRLVEMGCALCAAASQPCSMEAIQQLCKQLLVFTPSSAAELLQLLQGLENVIIANRVRLVVIDSVAALFRADFGRKALVERQEELGRLASMLKYFAERCNIAVIVTNQVTTAVGGSDSSAAQHADGTVSNLRAALGAKWAHCVNTRLSLNLVSGQRVLLVAKSPACGNVGVVYRIAAAGLQEIADAGVPQQLLRLQTNTLDMAVYNDLQLAAGSIEL